MDENISTKCASPLRLFASASCSGSRASSPPEARGLAVYQAVIENLPVIPPDCRILTPTAFMRLNQQIAIGTLGALPNVQIGNGVSIWNLISMIIEGFGE